VDVVAVVVGGVGTLGVAVIVAVVTAAFSRGSGAASRAADGAVVGVGAGGALAAAVVASIPLSVVVDVICAVVVESVGVVLDVRGVVVELLAAVDVRAEVDVRSGAVEGAMLFVVEGAGVCVPGMQNGVNGAVSAA
jgi:hypothetical protein